MIDVPFLDVGATYRELKPELDTAVIDLLEGGWYIFGPEVDTFEAEFAEFAASSHCVGIGNGLDALRLSRCWRWMWA